MLSTPARRWLQTMREGMLLRLDMPQLGLDWQGSFAVVDDSPAPLGVPGRNSVRIEPRPNVAHILRVQR